MDVTLTHWLSFHLIIFTLLGIDLWRFYKHPHAMSVREALLTSAGWISLTLLFNLWIAFKFGSEPALMFLTGYLMEESLSIDNLFLFLLIFSHFKVPEEAKHSVLFYGVISAIFMRALLIAGGISIIQRFNWIFPVFGLFLIISGIHLLFKKNSSQEVESSIFYRKIKTWIPFSSTYHGQAYFVYEHQRWVATPLFFTLILIEITDLIFALDSVPAILGITQEPFLVYTSNIFAILGLRSLFFALEGTMKLFYLLPYALALILIFIGIKMILSPYLHISTWLTLLVLSLAIGSAIIGSFIWPLNKKDELKIKK